MSIGKTTGPMSGSIAIFAPRFAQEFGVAEDKINRTVLELMKGAIKQAKNAQGKQIVAVVGNTGTGKSTLINHLCGALMQKGAKNTVVVQDPSQEKAKIGHRPTTSETLYTQTYQAGPILYADCGGFLETRGAENQIAVVSSIKFTLERSSGVSLLLAYNAHAFFHGSDRGVAFAQVVRTALQELLTKFEDGNQSIGLVFTKGDGAYTKQQMINKLTELYEDLGEGALKEMYGFILREDGRFICVYNPLDEDSKEDLMGLIRYMRPITNTKGAFKIAYSSDSKIQLLEQMSAIAALGSQLYDEYSYSSEAIERLLQELEVLQIKINAIETSIQQLGNGESDPQKIEAAEKKLLQEHETLIEEQKQIIIGIELKKEILKASESASREKMSLLSSRGDEEVSYWTDSIDQEGINIVSKTTNTAQKSSSGFLGLEGSSSKTTSVTETVDKRSISRDFNYRGPKFSKVVKNPPEGSACWSNEQKTETSFSVHYESGKGEPAKARVEIFTQRKFTPEQLVEEVQLVRENGTHNEQMMSLTSEIQRSTKLIHDAELLMAKQGSVMEKLEWFKASLTELKKVHQDLTAEHLTEKEKNKKTLEVLEQEMPNFVFLKDYLDISEDAVLAQQEIIRRFLQKHAQISPNITKSRK